MVIPTIDFESLDDSFDLQNPSSVRAWLIRIAEEESRSISQLTYIFCSDEYLLDLNKKYLDHDTYTDIITFPLEEDPIVSDIFISIDRVKENAHEIETSFTNELNRVMVHGLLHLCGYGDKSAEEVKIMRQKEDHYLSLFPI